MSSPNIVRDIRVRAQNQSILPSQSVSALHYTKPSEKINKKPLEQSAGALTVQEFRRAKAE